MGTSSFQISLLQPQSFRVNLNDERIQQIGLTTPIGQGTAKITIDTDEHWSERTTYIPKKGEIVIYSDRRVISGVAYPGIKIGDGLAYVVDLPFVMDDSVELILDLLYDHLNDMQMHVYQDERELWNNKVSCRLDGENLILERGGIDA